MSERPPHTWHDDTLTDVLAAPPGWMLVAQRRNGSARASEPLPPVIRDGEWHNTMVSAAGTLRRRGFSEHAATAALVAENAGKYNGTIPLDSDSELADLVADVYGRYEATDEIPVTRATPVIGGHTWRPASLLDIEANPPAPPTIGGMLYPAKRVVLSGETESLKTWLALILSKAEMDAGYFVAWADLDAMGAAELLARLRALGVNDNLIRERFLYYEPAERLIGQVLEDVTADITEHAIRLFIVDAFNPMLSLHGLDPNSTPDIETFWREVADPICRAGAAPTLLDHVAKNAGASKYAYGSERKASGATVHIGTRLLHPLTRGTEGRTLLVRHKDRPGYLPHPNIGRLILDSDGENITYKLEADLSHGDGGFRPTGYMERISMKLEFHNESASQKWIEDNVTGKRDYVRKALDVLADEGYIARTKTTRGYEIETIRPYREDDDQPQIEPDETSPRPRPDLAPTLLSTPNRDLAPSPPSKGARGEGEVDLAPRPRPGVSQEECEHSSFWLARDGLRRCVVCEPPAFPGEVVG